MEDVATEVDRQDPNLMGDVATDFDAKDPNSMEDVTAFRDPLSQGRNTDDIDAFRKAAVAQLDEHQAKDLEDNDFQFDKTTRGSTQINTSHYLNNKQMEQVKKTYNSHINDAMPSTKLLPKKYAAACAKHKEMDSNVPLNRNVKFGTSNNSASASSSIAANATNIASSSIATNNTTSASAISSIVNNTTNDLDAVGSAYQTQLIADLLKIIKDLQAKVVTDKNEAATKVRSRGRSSSRSNRSRSRSRNNTYNIQHKFDITRDNIVTLHVDGADVWIPIITSNPAAIDDTQFRLCTDLLTIPVPHEALQALSSRITTLKPIHVPTWPNWISNNHDIRLWIAKLTPKGKAWIYLSNAQHMGSQNDLYAALADSLSCGETQLMTTQIFPRGVNPQTRTELARHTIALHGILAAALNRSVKIPAHHWVSLSLRNILKFIQNIKFCVYSSVNNIPANISLTEKATETGAYRAPFLLSILLLCSSLINNTSIRLDDYDDAESWIASSILNKVMWNDDANRRAFNRFFFRAIVAMQAGFSIAHEEAHIRNGQVKKLFREELFEVENLVNRKENDKDSWKTNKNKNDKDGWKNNNTNGWKSNTNNNTNDWKNNNTNDWKNNTSGWKPDGWKNNNTNDGWKPDGWKNNTWATNDWDQKDNIKNDGPKSDQKGPKSEGSKSDSQKGSKGKGKGKQAPASSYRKDDLDAHGNIKCYDFTQGTCKRQNCRFSHLV
jgi:hypothetical protein